MKSSVPAFGNQIHAKRVKQIIYVTVLMYGSAMLCVISMLCETDAAMAALLLSSLTMRLFEHFNLKFSLMIIDISVLSQALNKYSLKTGHQVSTYHLFLIHF